MRAQRNLPAHGTGFKLSCRRTGSGRKRGGKDPQDRPRGRAGKGGFRFLFSFTPSSRRAGGDEVIAPHFITGSRFKVINQIRARRRVRTRAPRHKRFFWSKHFITYTWLLSVMSAPREIGERLAHPAPREVLGDSATWQAWSYAWARRTGSSPMQRMAAGPRAGCRLALRAGWFCSCNGIPLRRHRGGDAAVRRGLGRC